MAFKKVVSGERAVKAVGALLEVLPDRSEKQLVDWLGQQGVTEIESLAPGFLSVVATPETLRAAESMARVEIKHRKAMHGDR